MKKIVRRQDIFITKNYLTEDEIDSLNRIKTVFFETVELSVKYQEDIIIQFWKDNVDKLIDFQKKSYSEKGNFPMKICRNK